VASGDPTPSGVVLWTRLTPTADAGEGVQWVAWEMAEDDSFAKPVAGGLVTTDQSVDFTVKVDVDGLAPGKPYYYRFVSATHSSPFGRTRTLPSGQVESFALAVVSCAHFAQGRFHVYRELSLRDDVDLVLHLGDAIYESASSDRWLRPVQPEQELRTLADYRARYAYYRGDQDLRAAHARHPFVMVWDDHEVADNAYRDGALSHDASKGDYAERRNAAMQAYYEWLPVREPGSGERARIYRSFSVGSLLTMHVLDTRHDGREKQLRYQDYTDATGTLDAARFFADLNAPERALLSDAQRTWLYGELQASSAKWQVLAQQVLLAPMWLPAPLALGRIGFSAYLHLMQRARTSPNSLTPAERALLAQPLAPYNLDGWDGYPAERDALLARARELDLNLVVLAGDSHNAWASDLLSARQPVGVELGTPSVSARGLEGRFSGDDPALVAQGALQTIPALRYAQTSLRGYVHVVFSEREVRGAFHFVDGVRADSYAAPAELVRKVRALPGRDGRRVLFDDA
jgi:alkaline phosphatase D